MLPYAAQARGTADGEALVPRFNGIWSGTLVKMCCARKEILTGSMYMWRKGARSMRCGGAQCFCDGNPLHNAGLRSSTYRISPNGRENARR